MTVISAGHVYLIESWDQKAVKVGFGSDPLERLRQCQTGNPSRLRLLYSFPSTIEVERQIQRLVAPYRLTGEWFSCMWYLRELFCSLEEEYSEVQIKREFLHEDRPDWVMPEDAEMCIRALDITPDYVADHAAEVAPNAGERAEFLEV